MITKSEVYKSLIRIQKESGQGLSGIVKIKSLEYTKHLDTLIQEGLVKACHTGGSIGHPESNTSICQQKDIMFGKMMVLMVNIIDLKVDTCNS